MDAEVRYAPEIFDWPTIAQSKKIILGCTPELTPEERWSVETPWLAKHIKFEHQGMVVDYGCGIGRLSRVIWNPVLGVDISPMMRRHAIDYVGRPTAFGVVSPEFFNLLALSGLRVSGMITIWVLQHVLEVEHTINFLMGVLLPGGLLWHIDLDNRSIPYKMDDKFVGGRDQYHPLDMLKQFCDVEEEIPVDVWPQYPQHDAGILRKLRRKG